VEVAGESEYTGQWVVVVLVERQNGGMWGEQGTRRIEAVVVAVSWEWTLLPIVHRTAASLGLRVG